MQNPASKVNGRARKYGRRGRHFRSGRRAAALRAFAAAHLRLGIPLKPRSLRSAADMCGSCPEYVAAAMEVLQAEDLALKAKILNGQVSLLEGAAQVHRRAALLAAYRDAGAADLVALGRVVGAEKIFDGVVVPAVV